ncbi:hypothetical protein [Amycolatopsis pigmentata]|uniref:Uncharacterized protein n=1 Tax=Amycolatopsis pigmentata TaxID=450801 RepID=A0ABW5FN31_9PSEU
MPLDNKIAIAVFMFVVGLVLLFLLWPGDRQGVRLLRRWGVAEPLEQDVADAVRYLRRRRFWYPWLFLGIPAVANTGVTIDGEGDTAWVVVYTILFGSLLAEILAQRPSREPRRSASLAQRGILDFAPLWALIVFGIGTVVTVLRLTMTGHWLELAAALVGTALAWLIVFLAVRRPSIGRPEVDYALRTRSARVAVGLGIAGPASLVGPVTNLAGLLFQVLSIVAFLAIAQPDRHRAAAATG